ncbi:hypothetical protein MKW94_014848 [Papaver nudicaule]|uniref:Inosine/uridine-preferring nucleoside hydrolase domain-containing protein n=3 Tax=Papaver nudicaule TaxID=74823 RepID=A0AA41SFI2_PAPNU|nr:hypothetical protein [Papaver nudicaule]
MFFVNKFSISIPGLLMMLGLLVFLLLNSLRIPVLTVSSHFLKELSFHTWCPEPILALGPLKNLALAVKSDSSFASKVKRIVVLGGSFFAFGNVNPAAEANIYGDPEAADVVFTSGANIDVVGINITTQCTLTDEDLSDLRESKGRHTQFLSDMCKFYRDWHVKSDGLCGIFLHHPVSFVALVRPDLFTYKRGVVRVETQGICVGHTLMDQGLKTYEKL